MKTTYHFINHTRWMNRAIIRSILLIASTVCALQVALSAEYAMTQISPKDGLPQADVKSVEFDNNGLMWVVTYEGVARYNGYDFENFPLYAAGNLSTQIRTVKCDNDGNIWIITMDQGLFIYNTSKEKMIHFSSQLEEYDDMRTTLYDVEIDRKSGDIWIAALKGAIYRIRMRDLESGDYEIKHYPTPNGDLSPANPSDMIIAEDDRLYFVKNKSIYRGLLKIKSL